MPRLRVRAAGATSRVEADLDAPADALRASLGLPASAALSLDNAAPLPPAPTLAAAGVRPGDLIYVLGGVGAALVPPPRPPSVAPTQPVSSSSPPVDLPSAAALAAATALVDLGCVPAWRQQREEGGGASRPLAPPPGWAPPAPLALTYAGVPITLRALALPGGRVIVAAGVATTTTTTTTTTTDAAAAGAARPPRPRFACAFQATLAAPLSALALADALALPAAVAAAATAGVDPPPCLLSLPDHVVAAHILPRLAGRDLAALAATCRAAWGGVTGADPVWRARYAADYGGVAAAGDAAYAAYAAAATASAAALPPRAPAPTSERPKNAPPATSITAGVAAAATLQPRNWNTNLPASIRKIVTYPVAIETSASAAW
jgi:hypothetical protein